MRKPSTISLKNDEDNSDTFSTSAPASTQAYLDDHISPHDSYNKEHSEDSDCFSDSSKKIRKKRQAYSKISDEIRVKLLECVKNGETLKSAAKRFKINYSSAKSILHTFRKEGRILKKSAQERTAKKRGESFCELEQTPKSGRLIKKNSVNLPVENISRSLGCLNGRGVSSRETTPVGSLTRLDDAYMENHEQQRVEENHMRTISGMEQEVAREENRNISYQEEGNHAHQYNKMGYYMNYNVSMMSHYHQQPHQDGRNYLAEGMEQGNYMMNYPREFESFNDMMNVMQYKSSQVDEFFCDPSTFLQQREMNAHLEHGNEFVEHGDNGYNGQFKSFMDTQSMFRDALKKGTQGSYSNCNNSGMRKSSVDLF